MYSRLARVSPRQEDNSYPSKAQVKTACDRTKLMVYFASHEAKIFSVSERHYIRFSSMKESGNVAKNQVVLDLGSMLALRSSLDVIDQKLNKGEEHRIILDKSQNLFVTIKPFESRQGQVKNYVHIRRHYASPVNFLEVSPGGSGITMVSEEFSQFREIVPEIMGLLFSLNTAPNCQYEHRPMRLYYHSLEKRWLDLDAMEFLAECTSAITVPQEAIIKHKQFLAEENQRLYMEALQQEENIKRKQKNLMELVIVCLVEDELREDNISGLSDGAKTDKNIRDALMKIGEVDCMSTYCNVANVLNIPLYAGYQLTKECLVVQKHDHYVAMVQKERATYSNDDIKIIEAIELDINTTLH